MYKQVEALIITTLKELNEELEKEALANPTADTRLFGGSGALDSLALVSFVTDLEDAIDEAFDKEVVLADEKAMSQKTSPFRSVRTLSEYIVKLLDA
ncbi:MAG: hypothetical protein ACQERK_07095 [Campylobacterota bacterium]